MERHGEDGFRGTKTGIDVPPPPMTTPSKLFFTPQWAVFSCVCHELCKRLWHPFLPPAGARQEKGGRKDRQERNVSSSLFCVRLSYNATEQLLMLSVSAWVWDPCENTMVAAESVEGEGQGTMTYMRNRGGRQGKNVGLVVERLDID